MTPTLVASRTTLPPEGAGPARGGPSLGPLPLFISFEGIDGAGKSTHISGLADAFQRAGRAVTLTREPGGTPLAEKLRAMVLNDPMDSLTESLLLFAARRDHIVQTIRPALARGEVVLCDRFTDATFAYQGAGRGFDLAVLTALETLVQSTTADQSDKSSAVSPHDAGLLQPDLTVWFDITPQEAAERLAGARLPDKFEAQPVAFFQRVAQGYADRQRAAPHRFARVNASQTRDAVWRDVHQAVSTRGWL